MKKALIPLALIGGLGVLWRSRREAKPERSIDKVMHAIRKSDLPERSKKGMLSALEDAQVGMDSLRKSMTQMAKSVS